MTVRAKPAGKLRYPERWAGFELEERVHIAGSTEDAAELDALVEMLADGTLDGDARAARLDELRPELASIVARLGATVAHVERLRQQRRKLFAVMLLLGEPAARIGTVADVTAVLVSREAGVTVKQ